MAGFQKIATAESLTGIGKRIIIKQATKISFSSGIRT